VAGLLAERWSRATVFDPEHLGYLLRAWQPADAEVSDFQDLSVWRRLVRETAAGLLRDFRRPLIVPMTLLNPPTSTRSSAACVPTGSMSGTSA
jgi:hypothetical protein